jgi:secreted Zn-dependent insulinase-like peptidase
VIGHEGKGSLLEFLIEEGLATALLAGGYDCHELYSEFHITIILTKKGVENVK